nr:MAG TPA: hypothetical protein [Crassvirales sp.]
MRRFRRWFGRIYNFFCKLILFIHCIIKIIHKSFTFNIKN